MESVPVDVDTSLSEYLFRQLSILETKINNINYLLGLDRPGGTHPKIIHNNLLGLNDSNYKHVTEAQLTVIGNTSGTNTGDETGSSIRTALGITTLSGSNTGDDAINLKYRVLQVICGEYSAAVSTSSSSYSDTGLTATITPSSVNNKILVMVSQNGCQKNTGNTYLGLKLLRGASVLKLFANGAGYNNATTVNDVGTCAINYLDSPASTSAQTYKTQLCSVNNVANAAVQHDGEVSTIVLMEIAA
jgi:hypothetical protein